MQKKDMNNMTPNERATYLTKRVRSLEEVNKMELKMMDRLLVQVLKKAWPNAEAKLDILKEPTITVASQYLEVK